MTTSTTSSIPAEVLEAAGLPPEANGNGRASREQLQNLDRLLRQARKQPDSVVAELVRTRKQLGEARGHCERTAEAAEKLETMLQDLLNGAAELYSLEAVRRTPQGTMAVCSSGGRPRELPLHPDVDPEELEALRCWELVRVREQVVVGTWRDDPRLFAAACGEEVEFRGYYDRERGLVRVQRSGRGAEIVTLAPELREENGAEPLTAGATLVLQRDGERWAIGRVREQAAGSKFEVPLDSITTRLEDLAGMESLAETLIEEVLERVIYPDIRRRYGLDPLSGFLLSSYKPGMGKTAFLRAFAGWLSDLGAEVGFETVLYIVPPNATKSLWHGEDARIVREEVFGAIRARRAQRNGPLVQLLVLDEVDAFGKRPGGGEPVFSGAQSDSLESMLVELDGMLQSGDEESTLLVAGMTNRPDRIDEALKRPGRLGDLEFEMPEIDRAGAEDIMAIYATRDGLPWALNGQVRTDFDEETVRREVLRPAIARVFPATVLRYATETQRKIPVSAGEVFAGVHYKHAMTGARKRAASRSLRGTGVPAVTPDDVAECLAAQAASVAAQMHADRTMLVRQLKIGVPVGSTETVPLGEFAEHRYYRAHSA